MGKPVSISQSHQLICVIASNVDWSVLDAELVQRLIEDPSGTGEAFTRLLRGEATIASPNPDRILELVTEIKLPAATTAFIAKKSFVVDAGSKAKVSIACLGANFKAWFLGKTEEPMPETVLNIHTLRRNSPYNRIIAELGGERKAETTLQAIFSLMERQGQGVEGVLLTNGYANNIFYVRDKDGALRAVHLGWSDAGWHVHANSVLLLAGWCRGGRVFSCNSAL
jgi:hypothetical protein